MCVSRWHDGHAKILVPVNAAPDEDQYPEWMGLMKISFEICVSIQGMYGVFTWEEL